MQDMLVTLAATFTNALMDTSKNRRQFVNIILANIARTWMLLISGTGNGEPGTGVWELMYSGNLLENSKWRSKQKKGSKRNNLGKGEFPPAVPPDGQYVIA